MSKRYITYLFFSLIVAFAFAQPQLCVKNLNRGYVVSSNIDNREVVLMRSDGGSFEQAVKSYPVFQQIVDTWQNIKTINSDKNLKYALIDDGKGNPLPEYVEALCSDNWEQYSEPYTWKTPLVEGVNCCTGCVSQALAQILYYHKYPTKGTGSLTYFDSLGCKQTLTADFSSHTYEYDYMLDSYSSGNFTTRQGNAVAQLLSDCGIAVRAKYGVEATSASPIYQTFALVDYFGYDSSDLQMYYRDFFTKSEWHSMLHRELAEGRPVLISAWNENGGHSFIIDGYDENGLYHINFGLGGECDGYYNIEYMSPDQPQWDRYKDSPERGNNVFQLVTVGIKPKETFQQQTTSECHIFTFANIECEPIECAQNHFQIITNNLVNMGWNMFSDSVVLAICNTDGKIIKSLYEYTHQFDLHLISNKSYSDTISVDLSSLNGILSDGNYRIVPMFKDRDGWTEARTSVGMPNFLNAILQNGIWTISQPQKGINKIKVSNMSFPDTVYHQVPPHFSFTITNESEGDFNGRLLIELYPVGVSDRTQVAIKQVAIQGLYLKGGETLDLNYNYTPLQIAPGKYNLHVLCDLDLFTDSLVEVYTSNDVITVKEPTTSISKQIIDDRQPTKYYNLSGREVSPADVRKHPIIVKKANKTRKVLRSDYQIQ